jgi:hypothetical protein
MSFLDFLSPLLTTATGAASEYQGAKANAAIQQWQRAVQQALMQRQLAKEDAETAKLGADTTHIQHQNKAPVLGEPNYAPAMGAVSGAQAAAQVGPHVDQAVRTAAGTAPIKTAEAVNTAKGVLPVKVKEAVDISHGTLPDKEAIARARALSSPMGQLNVTRIATAAGQAVDADKIMSEYEDKVLGGNAKLSPIDAGLAKQMLHGGSVLSTAAETALNAKNPELAGYARAAKAMATAERLISPRGGSNAMMGAENLLAGAGPGASPELIQQARTYRHRLIQGLSQHVQNDNSPAAAPQSSDDLLTRYGIKPTKP